MELPWELQRCLNDLALLAPRPATRLLCLGAIAIPVFYWDIRHRRIPGAVTGTFLLVGGLIACFSMRPLVWIIPLRLCVGLVVPQVVRIATGGGIGGGDVNLSGGMAVMMGVGQWCLSLLAASILALLTLLATGEARRTEAGVPFGPYMLAGAVVVTVAGAY